MPEPERNAVTAEFAQQIAEIAGLRVDAARATELATHIQAFRDRIIAMDEIDLTATEPPVIFRVRAG